MARSIRMSRRILAATLCGGLAGAMVLLAPLAASAQDGASPKPIPKSFVLPGPPPTNAPAGTGNAPDANAARPPATNPAAKPSTVIGGGQTVQNPMAFAKAPPPGKTNWPCVQRRVEEIFPGQIWGGPPLPKLSAITPDADMRRLVDTVVARRMPLDEAETAVADFVSKYPKADRGAKAGTIVVMLLNRLNTERDQVMRGIERYGAKQKALAAKLRGEIKTLDTRQDNPTANPTALDAARQELLWDTRIFHERRQSLSYVCEVPTLIEQRAFALGRAAEQAL
ncbi:hypothetical protein LQ948_14775 [Jiella sp. MQZ9-1]|uniref:LTXXQ motif family protein n=1 Tax=Jiella flava TaxID=2816857 RepID=A0A939FYN0_9HYPH|nr:hypothetical protein [Jiella flava]MBO0663897.1 hypothetical protein [Jiella flava]MCD2472469.1 hypothetical protein [Jiella flava]